MMVFGRLLKAVNFKKRKYEDLLFDFTLVYDEWFGSTTKLNS